MITELMKEIVVWQITPNEECISLNGEVGIPYISSDGSNWLAIMSNGLIVDSLSLDITKKTIVDIVNQRHTHAFGSWPDGSNRLIASPSIVKRAMRNRAILLNEGWSYEFALYMLLSTVDDTTDHEYYSENITEFINYIGCKNINAGKEHYILSQAVKAYELYMNEFGSKKRLKWQSKKIYGVCESADVICLSVTIALINPCVDRRWENKYNQQGGRHQHISNDRLMVTFGVLQEKKDKLHHELYVMEVENECNDPEDYEHIRSELMIIHTMLEILEEDIDTKVIEKNVQIDAIDAAKLLLTFSGVPCGTNTIDQEWAKFVATAWEVTPSQIVSAAKALKKRESQEQK
ncbi:hypothetical protein ACJ5ZS_04870 [Aeromonas salmonicida]|uniref:hypothetical protein n=1 Tax=Aeromonas salmonicida TaxID=645 RepID=UPI0038BD8EE7